jgi:predicted acyltransferase
MDMMQLMIIGGGVSLVLLMGIIAFSGPSPATHSARRLQAVRFRHSDSTTDRVEAQYRKAVASRKPRTRAVAGSTSRLDALELRLTQTGKKWTVSQYLYISGGLALATALFGVECGRVLQRGSDLQAKVASLLRLGALWLLLGALWSWFLPINKPLWTSSYAVWTAGTAACGLGLCVWAFAQQGFVRWARPLQVYGTNALLVFVGSGLLGRILGKLWTVEVDGGAVSVKDWFFRDFLLAPIGDLKLASFAFACLWVLGWYAVLAPLYRRGIVWRV